MEIKRIDRDFSICKIPDFSQVDLNTEYCFFGKTDEENSLVCPTEDVPPDVIERDDGWKCFRIQGVLDFSLVGILAEIATLLAAGQIGIFAISTYHTYYILTKQFHYEKALEILAENGYDII